MARVTLMRAVLVAVGGLLAGGAALAHPSGAHGGGSHAASGGGHPAAAHVGGGAHAAFAPAHAGRAPAYFAAAPAATAHTPAPGSRPPGRGYGPRGYGYWGGYVHPAYYSFVPFLPVSATLLWWNGVPYYAAGSDYYVWNDSAAQYQAVPPPVDAAAPPAPPSAPATAPADQVYTYPTAGQSAEQQQVDRYECYRWATSQTGFDPTQPGGGVSPGTAPSSRAAYQRAELACLEARGYSPQ